MGSAAAAASCVLQACRSWLPVQASGTVIAAATALSRLGATAIAEYLLGAFAVYVLLRWLYRPLLWLGVAVWRIALGGAAIWGLDFLARPIGLHVALNPASALTAGLLGIPGLALLVVLGGLT